jgi:hypothetical protein
MFKALLINETCTSVSSDPTATTDCDTFDAMAKLRPCHARIGSDMTFAEYENDESMPRNSVFSDFNNQVLVDGDDSSSSFDSDTSSSTSDNIHVSTSSFQYNFDDTTEDGEFLYEIAQESTTDVLEQDCVFKKVPSGFLTIRTYAVTFGKLTACDGPYSIQLDWHHSTPDSVCPIRMLPLEERDEVTRKRSPVRPPVEWSDASVFYKCKTLTSDLTTPPVRLSQKKMPGWQTGQRPSFCRCSL